MFLTIIEEEKKTYCSRCIKQVFHNIWYKKEFSQTSFKSKINTYTYTVLFQDVDKYETTKRLLIEV